MSFYIAIEGADGCGKSTQATLLARAWSSDGCLHLREPGSTPLGEALRSVLLDPGTGELDPLAEALAFSAARREMLVREVAPALARGTRVIAERCYLSTVAYQCRAPAESPAPEALVESVTAGLLAIARPDLVIVLDVPEAVAEARLTGTRGPDRIESRPRAFHSRVRAAMRDFGTADSWCAGILRRDADARQLLRIVVLDGTAAVEAVHREVIAACGRLAP